MANAITFYIEGLNIHTTINYLCSKGYNLKISDKTPRSCKITTTYKDNKKVLAYLRYKCYNIKEVSAEGLCKPIFMLCNHPLLAIFCTLLLLFVAICSNYCLVINLEQTQDKQEQTALALTQYGITYGTNISRLNKDKLENYLCNNLNVAHAIVDVSGSVLSIELYPRIDAPIPTDYEKSYDIIAAFSGEVTRIVTLSGTALVKQGDIVQEGQVLIAGYRTFPDGTTEPIRALGEVYANVYSRATEKYLPTVTEYVKSEQYVYVTQYSIGDITIVRGEIPYAHYQTESKHYTLYPLNIVVTTTKAYMLVQEIKTYTFAQQQEQLCKKAREKAIQQANFTPVWAEYIINNDSVTAIVWAEVSIVYE